MLDSSPPDEIWHQQAMLQAILPGRSHEQGFSMLILSILFFIAAEAIAMAWVLVGRTMIASVALAAIVLAEWAWEITQLLGTAQGIQSIEPRIKAKKILLTYAGCWTVQVSGSILFYLLMRVHTLPLVFELIAAHVMVSAIFYLVRICVQGLLVRADTVRIAGQLWWEAGASCAGISPTCGLIAILINKALRLF